MVIEKLMLWSKYAPSHIGKKLGKWLYGAIYSRIYDIGFFKRKCFAQLEYFKRYKELTLI